MEKRGYLSHFKIVKSKDGTEKSVPRKRFTSSIVAESMCNKIGSPSLEAFYCSYCNGYHIAKKMSKH